MESNQEAEAWQLQCSEEDKGYYKHTQTWGARNLLNGNGSEERPEPVGIVGYSNSEGDSKMIWRMIQVERICDLWGITPNHWTSSGGALASWIVIPSRQFPCISTHQLVLHRIQDRTVIQNQQQIYPESAFWTWGGQSTPTITWGFYYHESLQNLPLNSSENCHNWLPLMMRGVVMSTILCVNSSAAAVYVAC